MARYYIEEDPENPGHMTKKLICGSFLDASPIGTVHAYAGSSVPAGWLACNGQAVSRSEYQFLFNVIGTTYGTGDGSTTFNVPDYRECALVGVGTNNTNTIAAHDEYTLGQFKDDQSQRIRGGAYTGAIYNPSGVTEANNAFHMDESWGTVGGSGGAWYKMQFDSARSARAGTTTHGKQVGVNYIIKAKLEANAGDIGLKTGIPVPDWGSAEAVSISSSSPTWTATKDGILVGYLDYSNTSGDITLSQNGVVIALSRFYNGAGHYYAFTGTISAQVRAGDVFTLSTSITSTQNAIKFVPYIS